MLFSLLYGAVLPICVWTTVMDVQVPSLDARSLIPSKEELEATAEAIRKGTGPDSAELVTLQESRSLEDLQITLLSDTRSIVLNLKKSKRLVSPYARAKIRDGDDESDALIHPTLRDSLYHGTVDGDEEGHVALGITSRGWSGHILHDGKMYAIHSVPNSEIDNYMLIRLNEQDEESLLKSIKDKRDDHEELLRASGNPEYELEVGLFSDKAFYDHAAMKFPLVPAKNSVMEIMLLTANTVHTYFQKVYGNNFYIVIVYVEIMKNNPGSLRPSNRATVYWRNFCNWDARFRNRGGENYDMSWMFSGMDLNSGAPDQYVFGMSSLGQACQHHKKQSCAIADAKTYGVAMFMTRNVGRNFGMDYDGEGNKCPSKGYIMSPAITRGSTTFSSCSKSYIAKYMRFLDDFGHNCLRNNAESITEHIVSGLLPGEWLADYPGLQCSYQLGDGWREDLDEPSFCEALHCWKPKELFNEEDQYQLANIGAPPIPGTGCGVDKICWNGECQDTATVKAEIAAQNKSFRKSGYKKKGLAFLCKKYAKKPFLKPLTFKKLNKWNRNKKGKKLNSICTTAMVCTDKKNRSKQRLPLPAPPGTPCANKKKCKHFRCQKQKK